MSARILGLISIVLVTSLTACTNGGFKAVRGQQTTFVDESNPRGDASELAQSPKVQSAQEAAQKAKIQIDLQGGPADADVIMGVTLTKTTMPKSSVAKVAALINMGGQKTMFKGTISTSKSIDGQALVVNDFDVDDSVPAIGKFEKTGVAYEIQAISQCSNACQDIFVHVQMSNHDKVEASAYYNFRQNDKNGYDLVNSSVETRYATAEAALLIEQVKAQSGNEVKVPAADDQPADVDRTSTGGAVAP